MGSMDPFLSISGEEVPQAHTCHRESHESAAPHPQPCWLPTPEHAQRTHKEAMSRQGLALRRPSVCVFVRVLTEGNCSREERLRLARCRQCEGRSTGTH